MKIAEIALQEAAMAGSGKITLFHKKKKEIFYILWFNCYHVHLSISTLLFLDGTK